jgi:hypothetical protein
MTTKTTTMMSILTLLILGCAGCGDGSTPAMTSTPPAPTSLTCSATLTASTLMYTITAADQLQFSGTGAPTLILTRKTHGDASRAIYGEWTLPLPATPELTLDSTLDIEPATVSVTAHCTAAGKSATAMVVSAATVTADQVLIRDDKNDTETLR